MDIDRVECESPISMRFPLYTVAEPASQIPMAIELEGSGWLLALFTDKDLCDQYMEDHEAELVGMIVDNRSDLRALCTMFINNGATLVAVDLSHRSPVAGHVTPLKEFADTIPVG